MVEGCKQGGLPRLLGNPLPEMLGERGRRGIRRRRRFPKQRHFQSGVEGDNLHPQVFSGPYGNGKREFQFFARQPELYCVPSLIAAGQYPGMENLSNLEDLLKVPEHGTLKFRGLESDRLGSRNIHGLSKDSLCG